MITIGSGTTEKVQSGHLEARQQPAGGARGAAGPRRARPPFTPATARRQGRDRPCRSGLTGAKAGVGAPRRNRCAWSMARRTSRPRMAGTDADYFIARDWDIALGRIFTNRRRAAAPASACIGQTVRQPVLRRQAIPHGQTIRVNRSSCKVIGVLETKGTSGFGQDQDNVVADAARGLPAPHRRQPRHRHVYVAAAGRRADARRCRQSIETIMREHAAHRAGRRRQFRRCAT